MEAATSTPPARPQKPSAPEREAREELDGTDLIRATADGQKPTDGEKADALEWFLSDDQESDHETIELNVGSRETPKWIEWVIRPVDLDTLKRIRKQSTGNRRGRREAGEIDEIEANLRIVVEGTVAPDLKEAAKQKNLIDPADALKQRFRRKPGLLGQIAGEVMSVSGYDDEDVREVDAGKR